MTEVPRIISVDDHVVEPPDLWSSRLPAKYQDRGPRIKRQRITLGGATTGGGTMSWVEDKDGAWSDVWYYDDLVSPLMMLSAAVGFDEVGFNLTTFDEIRKGSWDKHERLVDMAANHVDAAICFPNTLPRFCGQTFYEREDKELALLCVKAYNDWMIDEWSAGEAKGKLIPLTMVPLWDANLAADEVRRCAAKGSFAVTFPENPHPLGLPSIHNKNDFWKPFFEACEETGTVVCMHIGSSSKMPSTSPDAPFIISSTLTFQNAMGSLCDYLFSGTLAKYPKLTIAYSEGQVGWMPYILERADQLWDERSDNSFGTWLTVPPSSFIPDRVYGCIFDDAVGLRERNTIGMGQICFETDYPHADSTWPHSKEVLAKLCAEAGLDDSAIYQLARG
ncbi:MAG TPA: amidohydrolase family protein, partial [Acidimicrobiales bacterium]|nr:amidohydrolase family protein [Acidimicrobiales bacterium]